MYSREERAKQSKARYVWEREREQHVIFCWRKFTTWKERYFRSMEAIWPQEVKPLSKQGALQNTQENCRK